jgi:hypothetical protein
MKTNTIARARIALLNIIDGWWLWWGWGFALFFACFANWPRCWGEVGIEGLVGERHNGHLMIEQAWSFAENKEQERRLTPVGVVVLNMRGCGGGFVVAKVKPPKSLFCQTIHEMSGLFLMVDK